MQTKMASSPGRSLTALAKNPRGRNGPGGAAVQVVSADHRAAVLPRRLAGDHKAAPRWQGPPTESLNAQPRRIHACPQPGQILPVCSERLGLMQSKRQNCRHCRKTSTPNGQDPDRRSAEAPSKYKATLVLQRSRGPGRGLPAAVDVAVLRAEGLAAIRTTRSLTRTDQESPGAPHLQRGSFQ